MNENEILWVKNLIERHLQNFHVLNIHIYLYEKIYIQYSEQYEKFSL
jgi:hypothetical protein